MVTTTPLIFSPFFGGTGITPARWFVSPFMMLIPGRFCTHASVTDVRGFLSETTATTSEQVNSLKQVRAPLQAAAAEMSSFFS